MAKTNFNMQLTDTEKEIMDFVAEVVFSGYNFSKADAVSVLFKQSALNYLGMSNVEFHEISDEQLLSLLKLHKREEDKKLISFMGVDKYRSLLEEYKKNHPDSDSSYMEELLKDYLKQKGENHE